jgi:formate-dependent nitrite reductase membrane component NrfD
MDLKGLKFLAISKKSFEERACLDSLKKANADCLIVQAEPFCLGSGGLLLLLPVFLAGWINAQRNKRE